MSRFRLNPFVEVSGGIPGPVVVVVTDTTIDTSKKTSDGINTVSDFRLVSIEVEDVSAEDLARLEHNLNSMAGDLQVAVALLQRSPLVNPTRSQVATVERVSPEEVPSEFRNAGGWGYGGDTSLS